MGTGSYEFRTFTAIYTGANGVQTAITDGTKAALRKTKKDARAACSRRYD